MGDDYFQSPYQNFTQIHNQAIVDTRISAGSFRVLVYLCSLPESWNIENTDILQKLKIKSPKTLSKYLAELEDTGWIVRGKRSDGRFDYAIKMPAGKKHLQAKKGISTTNNTQYIYLIDECDLKGVSHALVEKYINYRKEIKKPLKTKRGLQTQINILSALATDEARHAAIGNTIDHEWIKIIPLQQQPSTAGTTTNAKNQRNHRTIDHEDTSWIDELSGRQYSP